MIGIIRHGDRTPKQKMKMVVTHERFIKLFEELNGPKTGHIKIKEPKLLQVSSQRLVGLKIARFGCMGHWYEV